MILLPDRGRDRAVAVEPAELSPMDRRINVCC